MGLINLKSNLSWYGKKDPGPYNPNTSADDTKFKIDKQGIPSVQVSGYSRQGQPASFDIKKAANSFLIDNKSFSTRGNASRRTQGGSGFPFLEDIGWHTDNRYADSISRLKTTGLADRYTTNSPIDEVYNKFKVREEAYNTSPYFKEPLILRGIQKDNNSSPERFGPDSGRIFDGGLIRGGILTNTERLVIDGLRIGKWLVRPEGLVWNLKQFGLQMSNPNVQNRIGRANPLALTKIYDPTSVLANTLGTGLGLRTDRHMPPLATMGRYGDIVKPDQRPLTGRMYQLKRELLDSTSKPAAGVENFITNIFGNNSLLNMLGFGGGQTIRTLTAIGGPDSTYGIGQTTIRRYENTVPSGEKILPGLGITKFDQNNTFGEFFGRMYHIGRRYEPAKTSTENIGFDMSSGERGDDSERSLLSLHKKLYQDGLGFTPPLIDKTFATYGNEIKLGDGLSSLNNDKLNFRNNRFEQYATNIGTNQSAGNISATAGEDGGSRTQKDVDNQFGGLKYKRGDTLKLSNDLLQFPLTGFDAQSAVHSEVGGLPSKPGVPITKEQYSRDYTSYGSPYYGNNIEGASLTEKEKEVKKESNENNKTFGTLRYGLVGDNYRKLINEDLQLTSIRSQTSKFDNGVIASNAPVGPLNKFYANNFERYSGESTDNPFSTYDAPYDISEDDGRNGASAKINIRQLYDAFKLSSHQGIGAPGLLSTTIDVQKARFQKLGGIPDGEGRFINNSIFELRANYSNKYYSINIGGSISQREQNIKSFGGGLVKIYRNENPIVKNKFFDGPDVLFGGFRTGLASQVVDKPRTALNSFAPAGQSPLLLQMLLRQNNTQNKYLSMAIGVRYPNPTAVQQEFINRVLKRLEPDPITGEEPKDTSHRGHGILSNRFLSTAGGPGVDKLIGAPIDSPGDIKSYKDLNATGRHAVSNPIKAYAAMSYGQLSLAAAVRNEGPTTTIDFRKKLDDQRTLGIGREQDSRDDSVLRFSSHVINNDGKIQSFEKLNQEVQFNRPKSGEPGRIRANRFNNNMPDIVNQIPYSLDDKNFPGTYKSGDASKGTQSEILKRMDKDFIHFKFYPIEIGDKLSQANRPIIFRAFIDDIADQITPNWNSTQDQGRADAKIMLGSWERTIDITFKVVATSAVELQHLYNKMEALAHCAYPDYSGTFGFTGRYVKVHIGDLYKNEPMYITSLGFSWDNETPWELAPGLQVPYYTIVNMSLGWMGNQRPDANKSKVFSIGSRNLKQGSSFTKANNYGGFNKNAPRFRKSSTDNFNAAETRKKIGQFPDY